MNKGWFLFTQQLLQQSDNSSRDTAYWSLVTRELAESAQEIIFSPWLVNYCKIVYAKGTKTSLQVSPSHHVRHDVRTQEQNHATLFLKNEDYVELASYPKGYKQQKTQNYKLLTTKSQFITFFLPIRISYQSQLANST